MLYSAADSNAPDCRRDPVHLQEDREDPGLRRAPRGGRRGPRGRGHLARDRRGALGRGPPQRRGARGAGAAHGPDGALRHHLLRDVPQGEARAREEEGDRALKLSREKVLHLSHLILGHLDKDDGVEYFDEPQEIRQTIVKIIMDEMKNDEAIDALVRRKLETQKRIVEGSDEWDVLYRKYFEEETAKHRKVMP